MGAYPYQLYHSEKLQSTKTVSSARLTGLELYHSEKLQSTKTDWNDYKKKNIFIIAKNYRVLKLRKT